MGSQTWDHRRAGIRYEGWRTPAQDRVATQSRTVAILEPNRQEDSHGRLLSTGSFDCKTSPDSFDFTLGQRAGRAKTAEAAGGRREVAIGNCWFANAGLRTRWHQT